MDRSKFVAIPLALAVGAAVLYGWSRGWWSLISIADGVLDFLIAGIAALLVWAFHSEIRRAFRRGQLQGPDLKVTPLPHLRGWMQPTNRPTDFNLYEGEIPVLGTNPKWGRPTHPERIGQGIHPAQVLELVWLDPKHHPTTRIQTVPGPEAGTSQVDVTLKELAVKFGVLSVTNRGREAEHCSAQGWYKVSGERREQRIGLLNWYSLSKEMALKRDTAVIEEISKSTAHTVNEALENPFLDIPENATESDECDLCLFYVPVEPELPYLYVAAPGFLPIPMTGAGGKSLQLKMRVRFKARGMRSFERSYQVTAKHDRINIVEKASDRPH